LGLIAVVIEFLAKAPIFMIYYGYDAKAAFSLRGLNALLNLPLRIVVLYFAARATEKPMERIISRMKLKSNGDFKSFANSFQAVTVPGLERIDALLDRLSDPQKDLKFIHVAGTNGKGSTCSALAEILTAKGFVTGKYISPNLIRVNERISVSGVEITDGELDLILKRIEPLAREVEESEGLAPTQFEIWTAAAMVYFKEKHCDYVVLEVGLGGEFDATNVIPHNEIAVITRLGLDHTQYLGNTIEEVAAAKAGIIKGGSGTKKVVTASQEPRALAVLRARAQECGCQLVIPEPHHSGTEGIYESFDLGQIKNIRCGIGGYHQIENMALAAEAALCLGIEERYIKEGIQRAKNPARFEIISEDPTVIYDGGHNENGIGALVASLERYFPASPKTVIFACMKDKEISQSLKMLDNDGTEFIFTEVKNNPRADTAEETLARAEAIGIGGVAIPDIGEAYREATGRGRLTVICGSLYLYKDLYEYLKGEK
jgi:dihydrofolate synthase/folylpolyglutamate synthase